MAQNEEQEDWLEASVQEERKKAQVDDRPLHQRTAPVVECEACQ